MMVTLTGRSTKTAAQFRAALLRHFKRSGIKQQHFAARLGVSHALISQIIRDTGTVSLGMGEKIASELGYEFVDFLLEGRRILSTKPQTNKANEIFSEEQLEAIEDFKTAILQGGDGAELLIANAKQLAEKRRSHQTFINDACSKSA